MRFDLIVRTPVLLRAFSFGLFAGVCGLLGAGPSVIAAETIRFQFNQFSREVSIKSLEEFSRSGVVGPELRPTMKHLKPSTQEVFRSALTQSMPLDPSRVAKFLDTPIGQSSLQQLVKVLAQPPEIAEPALSSALILGSAKDGELSFIDVLEAYPTEILPINVAALLSLGRQLKRQFNFQNALFTQLTPMLGTPSEGPTLSELAKPGQVSFTQIPFQFQGKDGRNITAVVYLPSSATPSLPASLVVIAPGLNTDMNALLYAGKQLASHGYAVASLNFPFTSNTALKAMIKGTGQIPAPNTWYFQPLSVSELIDQVQSRWGERVNTNEVGAIGQSLGGYTVMALAGAELDWKHLVLGCAPMDDPVTVVLNSAVVWQCVAPGKVVKRISFRDPRVKAALAINPVTNPIFSAASLGEMDVPIMMISGTNDILSPPISQQLIPFTGLGHSDSRLVIQHKGTHFSFLEGVSDVPGFLIGPDQALARTELKGLAKAWFDQHLRAGLDPFGSAPLLAGDGPLKMLVLPPFTREQLQQADPGLREFP